ncbi:phage/plasmid replication domain-containing protein [Heyndrickxia ginsengihumi]|uniref:phage/plasmid replication domain-containing protein n=1 Tax=Heyndrickxia ginsengihumi TaxID=363870 RepID=UPI003D227991
MFDTIQMSVPFELNHDDEIVINDDFYIRFNPLWNRLMINVSIPKLLYGNNIQEVTEQDIDRFFNIIDSKIDELFKTKVEREQWQVYRLDFCKNFKMDNQKQVTQYINSLSKIKLPRKQTITYGQETASFKNKSQTVNFYDKLAEMKKNKAGNDLLEQSKGILRFEIQCRKDTLKQYENKRKAVDLLTQEMFEQVMSEQLEMINIKLEQVTFDDELNPALFDIFSYSKLERIYAFSHFLDMFGETYLKTIYEKSYHNRQRDLKEYHKKLEQKRNNKLVI